MEAKDISDMQVGRGGVRLVFKDGREWLITVKDAFTPRAKLRIEERKTAY